MRRRHKKSKNDKSTALDKIILATGVITLLDKLINLIEHIISLF